MKAIALIVSSFSWWNKSRAFSDNAMDGIPDYKGVSEKSILEKDNAQTKLEPSYLKYFEAEKQKGAKDIEGVKISIPATQYSASGGAGISEQSGVGGRSDKALVLTQENSWVETRLIFHLTVFTRWR